MLALVIFFAIVIVLMLILALVIIYAEDDARLKIVFFALVILFAIAIIGVWEYFLKPLLFFIGGYLAPALPGALNIFK